MAKTATSKYIFIIYITFAKVQHIIDSHSLHYSKTKWMTHLGCFSVNGLGDSTSVQLTNITNNQPKICSRQCGNWNFFALLDSGCFCFNDAIRKDLVESMSNKCQRRCPDYTDKMYCGSKDMYYVNIYRHEKDLFPNVKDQNLDCLTVSGHKMHKNIKQMPCNKAVSFICSGQDIPVVQKLPFKDAKQFCENSLHKLMNINERLPQTTENNTHYWIGTFRQFVYRYEEITVRPPTLKIYVLKSTQDIYTQQSTTKRERTFDLVNMSTMNTERSTWTASTTLKSTNTKVRPVDINCGIFCIGNLRGTHIFKQSLHEWCFTQE
ncbi:uncharacterized protein LOC134724590 isoform X2 [Mytilus trossulus]|uniref:uncharacterized protein LOC134724590 isoform X2 n=1 Tax=Mytilus trossulus TaxID=6551 RepID=UPI003005C1CC